MLVLRYVDLLFVDLYSTIGLVQNFKVDKLMIFPTYIQN